MIKKNNEHGFTLVELLIAITIFAIAVGALGNITLLAVKSFRRQQVLLEMTQNAEFALDRMTKEISAAVYRNPSYMAAPATAPQFVIAADGSYERLDFNAWAYSAGEQSSGLKGGDVVEIGYRIFNDVDFGLTLQRRLYKQDKTASPNKVIPDGDIQNPSAANKGNIIAFYCDDLQIQANPLGSNANTWNYPTSPTTLPDLVRVTIQMFDVKGEVSKFQLSADICTKR